MRPTSSRVGIWLLVASLLLIAVATLTPARSNTLDFWSFCLVCGEQGVADVIANLILFLPLGIALGLLGKSRLKPYVFGLFLSAGVELLQVFIRGRDANLADVVWNGAGTLLGVFVAHAAGRFLDVGDRAAARLSLGASIAAILVWTGTAALLAPAYPSDMPYFGEHQPVLEHLGRFRGVVLDASLGGESLPEARFEDAAHVRELLVNKARITVRAIAGPPPEMLAPVLSIDGYQTGLVRVAIEREDVLFHHRMRAEALRLDRPAFRLAGAMSGVAEGDTFRIDVVGREGRTCIAVNGRGSCRFGFTVADGWRLLSDFDPIPLWTMLLIGAIWMAALLFPSGFWARSGWETALGPVLAVAALFAIPAGSSLLATPPYAVTAAASGFVAGILANRRRRKFPRPNPDQPSMIRSPERADS